MFVLTIDMSSLTLYSLVLFTDYSFFFFHIVSFFNFLFFSFGSKIRGLLISNGDVIKKKLQ